MFATRTLALAVSVALFSQAALAANKCVREYTVKGGDICDSISAANNVSTYQLAALNPTTINPDCTNLQPGSTLCIGSEGEDCSTTYVVQAGNTCAQVLQAGGSGLNSTIFSLNNPQVNEDCTNIYVGQVLCVADEVRVPPAPGVPIHTLPPATATLANPAATSTAPAVVTTAPAATITDPAAPAITTPAAAPAAAAPVTTKIPVKGGDAADGDEEDCEEYEVVEGPTDEDLPFCDELF